MQFSDQERALIDVPLLDQINEIESALCMVSAAVAELVDSGRKKTANGVQFCLTEQIGKIQAIRDHLALAIPKANQ